MFLQDSVGCYTKNSLRIYNYVMFYIENLSYTELYALKDGNCVGLKRLPN